MARILAGPWAGQTLADLGAEVIKVERHEGGDDGRRMGVAFHNGDSLLFQVFNRGKHSVTITWVYQGDCPPELAPGQVERPDGEVVEMASMRNGMGAFGRGGRGGASNATASNSASNSTASK